MTTLEPLNKWYASLNVYKGGFPARGTLAGALAVTERLKQKFKLDLAFHTAKGGTQVKGASGAAVGKILAQLGEHRKFLKEGGRTNRGLRAEIGAFLDAIDKLGLAGLSSEKRVVALEDIQRFLLARVRDFFSRERIKFVFTTEKSTANLIGDILAVSRVSGKEGPVAQYLVGAKLQLRFPSISISNDSYAAADEQTGRLGDFTVQDTAFHVTVAPMTAVFEKCVTNLNEGKNAFLLVPARSVEGARQNADNIASGRIDVSAIESFVGFNVNEIAMFGKGASTKALLKLLEIYNARVKEVETDLSLMIEIPKNLGA